MWCRPVAADGNCLFRAASVALSGDYDLSADEEDKRATELRRLVVVFMRNNRASFEGFLKDDVDFDQYTQTMQLPKEWGGEMELSAIARLTRRPVHVYTPPTEPRYEYVLLSQYPDATGAARNAIRLLFHERHYDALFE